VYFDVSMNIRSAVQVVQDFQNLWSTVA
jgi:hypothetical protein